MPSGRPIKTRVPYGAPMSTQSGRPSKEWEDYFRTLDERLESKYVAATSSYKNLSDHATGIALVMPTSKVNLSAGTWRLTGSVEAGNFSTMAVGWREVYCVWSLSDGDGVANILNVTPITTLAGFPNVSFPITFDLDLDGVADGNQTGRTYTSAPTCRVSVSRSTDVYLNVGAFFTGAANTGFVRTSLYAERISNSVSGGTN